MSTSVYLSRYYVEFGPLTPAEVIAYFQRGMLGETDYVRAEPSPDWLPVSSWASSHTTSSAPPPAAPAAKKAAKKAAVKKATTKT